jgi:Camelysin metallo-endopeptidase
VDYESAPSRGGLQVDSRGEHRLRRRLALLAIVGLAILSLSTGASSLANFTASQSVDANTFTAGTVVLGLSPTTALITYANMAPGDVVTAPLTVTNSGTLDLRYSATSSATNADSKGLAAALVLTVKTGVTTCTTAQFSATGVVQYTGILGSVPPTAATKLFGDNTPGADAGDRTLVAAANEPLCFQASLPSSAGNTMQGSTTTATFTFDAEQTKNNP